MAHRKYFTVQGNGNFPFVMLSRDECYPASTAEGEKMALACPTVAPAIAITFATNKDGSPNHQMWKALKWPIILVE